MFPDNLKYLRMKNNMEQLELARLLGRKSSSSISEWEKGKYTPKLKTLNEISKIFKVEIDDLMNLDLSLDIKKQSIETIYSKLNTPAQKEVYSFAEKKLEEQESLNSKIIPMVGKTAANPSVLEYGDVDIEQQSFSHVPEGADCAIYIQGDSMEPLIKDGSIVFYKRQEDVESGEIAVVEINGDGATCKRVIKDYDNRQIILRSVNDRYEDRILHDEDVRIIGKVIL